MIERLRGYSRCRSTNTDLKSIASSGRAMMCACAVTPAPSLALDPLERRSQPSVRARACFSSAPTRRDVSRRVCALTKAAHSYPGGASSARAPGLSARADANAALTGDFRTSFSVLVQRINMSSVVTRPGNFSRPRRAEGAGQAQRACPHTAAGCTRRRFGGRLRRGDTRR
jgi:hypothetical protein